jgi:hypothetical protein
MWDESVDYELGYEDEETPSVGTHSLADLSSL